jgi:hypothetical protein
VAGATEAGRATEEGGDTKTALETVEGAQESWEALETSLLLDLSVSSSCIFLLGVSTSSSDQWHGCHELLRCESCARMFLRSPTGTETRTRKRHTSIPLLVLRTVFLSKACKPNRLSAYWPI